MLRRLSLILFFAALSATARGFAGDPPKEGPAKESVENDRATRLKQVNVAIAKKRSEAMLEYQKAKTDAEKQKIVAGLSDFSMFTEPLFELVKEDPTDAVSVQALAVLLAASDSDIAKKAVVLLTRHHATSDQAGKIVGSPVMRRDIARPFLEKVFADHADRDTRAKAAIAIAEFAISESEHAATPEASVKAGKVAQTLLQKLIDDYGDVKVNPKATAAEWAKRGLIEVRDLGIGQPFPNLESRTPEGKSEKIADYRGKVVVVDVWATWCGPCKAMIPHERELVARLKDRPFTLLSISGDQELETLQEFLKKTEMPWSHWWARGENDKTLKQLNIRHYPTVFVLDGEGIIRYKGVRGPRMDEAVETLLTEISKK